SHYQCRHQRPAERDQRDRPWPGVTVGPGVAAVALGLRDLVIGEVAEQKSSRVIERQIKHDGPDPGDDPDRDAQRQPLAQVARPIYPGPCPPAGGAGGPAPRLAPRGPDAPG